MNFRILIGPKGRNQGFGTEATRLIIDYVFQNSDLKQITLGVYSFNPRAKTVYEKIGFVSESIDKDDLEFEGQMIDSINMVLTRERWQLLLKYNDKSDIPQHKPSKTPERLTDRQDRGGSAETYVVDCY